MKVFERMIGVCEGNEHWMGGDATYSTECGVWKLGGWNRTREWVDGEVGKECVRWVDKEHPDGE